VTGDSGWSDAIMYTSPAFAGATVTLFGAPGEGNGGRNAGATVSYSAGPLAGGLVWQQVEKGSTVQDTTTWQAAGSYDFTIVKVFAQYGSVSNDSTGRNHDISGLGFAVPVGPLGKALLQWGHISPDAGASRTTVSLGYDHYLSKRTDLYGAYMSDQLSGLSNGNSYSLGIRHRF
jgi:predicted porin